jgi:hypothetical protein
MQENGKSKNNNNNKNSNNNVNDNNSIEYHEEYFNSINNDNNINVDLIKHKSKNGATIQKHDILSYNPV